MYNLPGISNAGQGHVFFIMSRTISNFQSSTSQLRFLHIGLPQGSVLMQITSCLNISDLLKIKAYQFCNKSEIDLATECASISKRI